MKVLCICNHGNNRSGALARWIKATNGVCGDVSKEYLKEYVQNEAIAIGAHSSSQETIKLLCEWADKVVDLSDNVPWIQDNISSLSQGKYYRFDIGRDRWGSPVDPELEKIAKKIIEEIIK